jgi:hypothetical protein
MSFVIDLGVLAVVALGVFASVRRGLFFSLFDILRIVAGLACGFSAYSLAHQLTRSYTAGFVALGVVAFAAVMVIPAILRLSGANPAWGRTTAARIGAGGIGAGIGLVIAFTFMPVLNQNPGLQSSIGGSLLGRTLLDGSPLFYHAADALNLNLPMLNRRAVRFEDEGMEARAGLVERINYSRLGGSTCIECGAAVRFDGYRRRLATSVSPKFVCPVCGRTSDGCQTFEGFHRMYDRCPVDVAAALGPIDCGVWSNDRPVYPRGACPLDRRRLERR